MEQWNLLELSTRNLQNLLGTLELLGTLTWNFGTFWNLHLEPLHGTTCNLHLEPPNLLKLLLGTLEPLGSFTWNPDLEPLLGTSEPRGTLWDDCPRVPQGLVWLRPQSFQLLEKNPYSEPRNLCLEPGNLPQLGTSEPLLGTFAWNLGTCRNLTRNPWSEPRNLPEPYLEPLLGTSEPLLGTSEPAATLLGSFARNLGTCRNLYLEPLLGTSEPAGTRRDDCPKVPQGLVWLGPQSFQLLGKNIKKLKRNQTMLSISFHG